MLQTDIREHIHRFVLEDLASSKGIGHFSETDQLIDNGVIDSLGIFRLVKFLEDRFGIQVPDDDVISDNFQTVADMEQYVQSRMARRGTTSV
jgi:acyl carrier protein